MKRYIKYEELSGELKKEIQEYHERKKDERQDLVLEDAMIDWFDKEFEEWIVNRFEKGTGTNKRKNVRFQIEVPVKIVEMLVESSSDELDVMDMVGVIINMCRGGLYFKSEEPIKNASIIRIEIDLSSVDRELKGVEALAMVVRSEKLESGDYGIGVMISSIYDDHKDHLDLFVFRNLANYVYKESDKIL